MKHIDCTQNKRIETIKQLGEETFAKVEEVSKSLEEHLEAQQEKEKLRENDVLIQRQHDENVDKKLEDISASIKGLVELNTEVNDMKTAWRVAKRLGLGMALFIGTMSIITGGIYAIKNWIKN